HLRAAPGQDPGAEVPARYRRRGGQHLHPRRDRGQARHRQKPGAAAQGREDDVKRPAKPKQRRLSPAERARIAEIFRRFEAASPDPRPELTYKTPSPLLVAVWLWAQATEKPVNKATERLYQAADTPAKMVALG